MIMIRAALIALFLSLIAATPGVAASQQMSRPVDGALTMAADATQYDACVTSKNCAGGYQVCVEKCRQRGGESGGRQQTCSNECQPAMDRCIDKARAVCTNK